MRTAKTTVKSKHPKKATPMKSTKNVFSGAADALGAGIDALFAQDEALEFAVNLDDIEVVAQVREQFEDDEQELANLGESLAKYQIQAILLRTMPVGHPKPYRLVAGERRYRAARLQGLSQLRAKAREMTDEEAEDFQFAENIHRKNLTQIEEAKKIQRDLDKLGSVEAVLNKHQKSRAWLSKVLSLLRLPEQAKRLIAENVSADVEVINTVKIIEKADPEAAKELVEDLKQTRGKHNAREKANAVKDRVKPIKQSKVGKGRGADTSKKGRHHEVSSATDIFADAKIDPADASAMSLLDNIYDKLSTEKAENIFRSMEETDKEAASAYLHATHETGTRSTDIGNVVLRGLRNGHFAQSGSGAFALAAFLQGAEKKAKFDILKIFTAVKA